jgi:triosephosphate isomerase
MRRAMVAGNWKMNATGETARALAAAVAASKPADVDVALCPAFPYLRLVVDTVAGSEVSVGGQDLSSSEPGAHTGDVAGEMLLDVGCSLVLVGHSERRHAHAESDEHVAAKFCRARAAGLLPVLCVGETLAERENGDTGRVVERQLDAVFAAAGGGAASGDFVLAYEPVWAIGTGRTASPAQAQEVHAVLRERMAAAGVDAAATRILYGGSVKPENAAELFAMEDIDGGLIGGASLQADDFLAICRAAGD